MNGLVAEVLNLSAAATGALISAIWQGTLLALFVMLVLRLFPGLKAAARSAVWLNVFVLLVLLHVLPVFTAGSGETHTATHAVRLSLWWSVALAALWIAFSLFRAGQLVVGAVHLRRLARRATRVNPSPEVQPLLEQNGHAVELCVSSEVARPSVLGFFRPRILVPPALLEELSADELRQVVLHEMEHLHRSDDWVNLLQKLALVLFPLNPALAWVERRLCAERELACDDRVLDAGSGRKAYALCLTHLAEFSLVRRGFSLVLGAWERRPELARRVHRILSEPARSMGRRPALAAMGALTTGALACTLVLSRSPEMVRFAPLTQVQVTQQAKAINALDAGEVSRALGGSPQFVKATLPPTHQPQPARSAVLRKRVHKAELPVQLACLRTPPPPTSEMLIMLTQWNETLAPARMIVTFTRIPQARAPVVIPVKYAVVRT